MAFLRLLHDHTRRMLLTVSLLWLGGFVTAPAHADVVRQPALGARIIAHRCYNAAESAPENSLEALQNALRRGDLYAVEMDVWVTADGVVVVHHDDAINGVSLERYRYDELKAFRLKNGEPLPTLASFLALIREVPEIKAVIEIKEHTNPDNGLRAADAIVRLVSEFGVENRVEYQSFDLAVCQRIIHSNPEAVVGYPRGDLAPAELRSLGFRIMDYHYGVLFTRPFWIQDARRQGLRANGYTMNSYADMLHAVNLGIDCITTDFPEDLRAVLEWRENSALKPILSHPHLTQAFCALRNTPLAIVYALLDSCRNAASAFQAFLGLRFLSLTQFYSLLSSGGLLFVFVALACFSLWRRAGDQRLYCPHNVRGGRLLRFCLSFCSPNGRIAPLAFWWRQLLLILPLYLSTYATCLAGKCEPGLGWWDEAAVISILLAQVCPSGLLASGLACVQVHYAGGGSAIHGGASFLVNGFAAFCLMMSLLAAWCSFSLVLRRLRDSCPGLCSLPLCLSLLWIQFIMLTKHRPVWLDDALILLVLLVAVICVSLPSRSDDEKPACSSR